MAGSASAAIGIMCKAPRPGQTKTRLAATIGGEQAASLSACFLHDVAAAIESVAESLRCEGYGVYTPAGAEADLRRIFPPSFRLLLQSNADFGNVLHGAVSDLLVAGHDCAVLVNGDSPTLPPNVLANAIGLLRKPGDRMVLGPASDGGYYLIGLKRPHPHLFVDIPWGTDAVARLTLERAAQIGIAAELLPEWYDVDDIETLGWLRDELAGQSARFKAGGKAAATRAYLTALSVAAQ